MGSNHRVLAIDGGGTKTDILLYEVNQQKGVQTTGDGTNPNIYGMEGIKTLSFLLTSLSNQIDSNLSNIDECIIGMAGISHPKYRNELVDRMTLTVPNTELKLVSDAELAHRCLWGNNPGITLIVGTGSIILGCDTQGQLHRSGGLGYQVGDEGSGYWLGKTLLTELVVAERSTAEDVVELIRKVLEHSSQSTFEGALNVLSSEKNPVSGVANLAPMILSSAEEGNVLAFNIVMRGAEALEKLIEKISEKLDLKDGEIKIGVSGSVITRSDYYRTLIQNQLRFQFDSVEWFQSDFPPVYGALVLSRYGITPKSFSKVEIEYV